MGVKYMRKLLVSFLSIILCSALLFSSAEPAFGLEATPDEAEVSEKVITVSTQQIDEDSFVSAVQDALIQARNLSDDEHICTVKVAPGEYILDRVIRLFSNTELDLTDVTIKRARGIVSNMVRTGTEDGVSEGAIGYEAYKNITIKGGVFDADFTSNTMIKLAHARNITLDGVTLKNLRNSHMMEVAGVDGFTLKNCTFENQQLELDEDKEICYEAVQLDVLKKGHIVNCRSEDIPMKNVLVEGCTFDNCPRGVGSHTAILNNPFENISIRNNTFTNMTSVAIQTMNWNNCSITDNYIDNTPRGIAVYKISSLGKGMYLAGDIAAEGNTEAHVSDDYNAPENSNTLIAYNTIKNAGMIEDTFASYSVTGISVLGYDLTNPETDDGETAAKVPRGDYYANGVTIRNNYVDIKGSGCRLDDVRNVDVESNVFYCGDNSFKPDSKYHGIYARYASQLGSIKNNYIKNAKINGIHIGENCTVSSVCNNDVDTASNYGIVAYNAKLTSILDNRVSNVSNAAIGVNDSAAVSYAVARNRMFNCKLGINITKSSSATLNCNTFICAQAYNYKQKSFLVTMCNNFLSKSEENGIYTDVKSVELSVGKSYRLNTTVTPLNAFPNITYSSSDESIAEVGSDGMIIAKSEGEAEVTVSTSKGKTTVVAVKVTDGDKEPEATAADKITMVNSAFNNYTNATLNWEKVSGASKYHVFRKQNAGWVKLAETNSNAYVDKSVTSGLTYYYTVRAVDKDSNYIGSYDTTGTKLTYVAPASIRVLRNYSNKIKASWNKIPGAARYRVFYRYANSDWISLGTTTKDYKYLKTVRGGYTYTFIVMSLDSAGNAVNYYYKKGSTRIFLSRPKLANSVSGKKIKLNWSKVGGAARYILMGKSTGNWKTVKVTNKNAFTYKGSYGKSYKFTIRCLDKSLKHSSDYSDYSNAKIKKPKPKKVKKGKKAVKKTASKTKNR